MRPLLLALALLPLSAQANEHEHEHASLSKHEHGVAQLNVVFQGNSLELELDSPAMNLLGFEHQPSSAADQATLAQVREQLAQPLQLLNLQSAAACTTKAMALESHLFHGAEEDADKHDEHQEHGDEEHGDEHAEESHSDIRAQYQLTCKNPDALKGIDFAPLFKRFPATQKLQVQLVSPQGQGGFELTPVNSQLTF